jgi:hypothetical protein
MRTFSNNVNTLLATDNVSIFYLVKIVTPTQTIRGTTAGTDIVIPTEGTFVSNDGLLIVDAPRLSASVDRASYKITYIDPEFEKRALFETGIIGAPVSVWVGFFNTTNSVLGGANPGAPLLSFSDMIVAYSGTVDTPGYAIDPENGTVFASLECSSPMASLGMNRSFYTTKEEMAQRNLSDTCFDQVSVNAQKVTYLWGKA